MKTLENNIFLTGQAGTGKSTTINNYIKWAKENNIEVALTASTGVAALNIGGITIHSFLGSKIAGNIDEYKSQGSYLATIKRVKKNINNIDVLVVDEISMLNDKYIDLIDYIMKDATKSSLPFGGKKIIFTGDFLQLPPISKGTRKFAFESKSWREAKFITLNLTKIYRQKDKEFTSILSRVRLGQNNLEISKYFDNINYDIIDDDDSVKLFSKNINVDDYNQQKLDLVSGESKFFECKMKGTAANKVILLKRVLANEVLELKIGARVMSLKNDLNLKYVNGSTGIVTKMTINSVEVKFDNGLKTTLVYEQWELMDINGSMIATFKQIPLKLAYAITIHKSQGMTMDRLTVDCEGIFEEGQFYVAISRASTKEGLKLIGFEPQMIIANPKAVSFYLRFENNISK